MHGHTYEVEIQLYGTPGADGMVRSYEEIADVWATLHDTLDHRVLNDVPGLEIPTTEALVLWLFDRLFPFMGQQLEAVLVRESETTWARITRGGWNNCKRGPGQLGWSAE